MFPKIRYLAMCLAALAASAWCAPLGRAQAAAGASDTFVPPTADAASAAGLLPPDKEMRPGHHKLLDRWTRAWGLTDEQRLWIEPQLHAEESLTKPVLGYKALNEEERKQILGIIKIAARRQIRILLTPRQQKLMDEEIASTERANSQ
jgi:hypothetical protein